MLARNAIGKLKTHSTNCPFVTQLRHTHTYTHMHTHTNRYTHMHTHTNRYTHMDTHTCAHRHTHTHRHTCTHRHIHTHTHTHAHTHTHVHQAKIESIVLSALSLAYTESVLGWMQQYPRGKYSHQGLFYGGNTH